MPVYSGVAVGLWLCFMACSIKKEDKVRIKGVSVRKFSNRLYKNMWGHVVIRGVSARTFSTRLYEKLWEHVV